MAGISTSEQRIFTTEDLTIKRPNLLKRLWQRLLGKRNTVSPSESIFEPIDLYLLSGDKNISGFNLLDLEDVSARSQYGPLVIKGYLLLLILQTLVPLSLWTAITWKNPGLFSDGLRDLQDFVVAASAGLTGISGLAGFVIGRYFRERIENK